VIALEHPDRWGGLLDLEPRFAPDAAVQLVDAILHGGHSELALRAGRALAPRLVRQQGRNAQLVLDPSATYLVSGGTGGIGLLLAEFLIERGARHLALCSRTGVSAAVESAMAAWSRRGVAVRVSAVDVADPEGLAQLLRALRADMPALRGIFHAAGVSEDGVLLQQDPERWARVLRPKVQGGWLLDRMTREIELDHFVVFSSLSAVLGAAGQAAYAAANASLDALVQQRRAAGLAGLSVAFGPWAQVGMAAGNDERTRRLRRSRGILELSPSEALLELEAAMVEGAAHALVARFDFEHASLATAESPLLADLAQQLRRREPLNARAKSSAFLQRLSKAKPRERRELLYSAIRERVARVLGLAASAPINPAQPLSELGLDSLGAVELRNDLAAALGRALPASLLFDFPTLDGLTDYLDKQLTSSGAGEASSTPAPREQQPAAGVEGLPDLSVLSRPELEAMLDQKLASLDLLEA
jgi:NADP-dependent 3-hydroxy acid dehydrogenase YdfG/acyl carrier protein